MFRLYPTSSALFRTLGALATSRRGPSMGVAPAAAFTNSAVQRHRETFARQRPYKDDQDRSSVKPRSQEYSKSGGGGDAAAAKEDAAFNPSTTRPEAEKAKASKNGRGTSPLDVSPANKDLSQPKTQENRAAGQEKQKRSGGGGVKK